MMWTHLKMAVVVATAFALPGGAGCATVSPRDRLLDRAAFDLRCARSALSVVYVEGDTHAVSGCGLQATYVLLCNDHVCNWLLNGGPRSES